MYLDLGGKAKRIQRPFDHLPGGVARIGGNAAVIRCQPNCSCSGGPRRHRHHVEEFERLVYGAERMKSVSARRANRKAEIDLGVRANGGRHTALL